MRILVTGGAGFIGSHFARLLASGGFSGFGGVRVTVLDALTYAGVRANLASLPESATTFVRGDICDVDLLARVVPGHDAIVHFAAESHVDRSIAGAARFVVTNVQGTQHLLDAAVRCRIPRFVHISTDEVYGSIAHGSWAEDQPLAPGSPYAATKAASDLLALAYHHTHGLDVVIVRSSNTYGPRQFPEKIIPRFVTNLLTGAPVPLYGDGGNVRQWLHVADHCRGVALVLEKGRAGEVYHVGGDTELSNLELTSRLLEACGADWSRVRRVADRKGHDRRYSVRTEKIEEELGYRPAVDFDHGLAATVGWYRENRQWWEPLRAGADVG